MSFEVTSFLITIVAGIFIGLPTGPARFFVVDTYLNDGSTSAMKVYFGLFSGIVIYAGLALTADQLLSLDEKVRSIAYLVASLLLIFWGVLIILKSHKGHSSSSTNLHVGSKFMKGFITVLSNPVFPFIYLGFIQLIESKTDRPGIWDKMFYLAVFEGASFLTTFAVAGIASKEKEAVLGNWRILKIGMGIILMIIGGYNTMNTVEFSEGIHLQKRENLIHEQLDSLQGP